MTPISPADPLAKSADLTAGNLAKLRELFPDAFTEGRIDFAVLKQLLGGAVDEGEEKYGLNWHGKRAARRLALTPSAGTLRPGTEKESRDWATTQNLMIEGDNLEVLKLLQKSYAGKVKLIYIDPPYNTGNDFVYLDDLTDGIANYKETTGQTKDGVAQTSKSNAESNGRFHANWLNMIYPRLKLAHNLLKDDGAIFVSCDECEHIRLRACMDEIFGEENFIADMVWAAGRKNDSRYISISHEYIVCYVRDIGLLRENKVEWHQRKKGLDDIYAKCDELKRKHGADFSTITTELKRWLNDLADGNPSKAHKHYCQVDARGVYFPGDISWPGGGGPKYEVLHPRTKKPVKVPSSGWRFPDPKKMEEMIADDRIHFGGDETTVPCVKRYLRDTEFEAPYSVFYQDGRAATKRLRELMGSDAFEFPKDETVIQEFVSMLTKKNDLILDFFAGSGTTGHAVMAQNAADGGNRRFILVQLPEPTRTQKENGLYDTTPAWLAGYPTIAEITKARLRRAADKIRAEWEKKQAETKRDTDSGQLDLVPGDSPGATPAPAALPDLGFRVYKLDSSNVREWDPETKTLADDLFAQTKERIKDGRTAEDLLAEVQLKFGLPLVGAEERRSFAGHTCSAFVRGAHFVCLSERIDAETTEALAAGLAAWRKELDPDGAGTAIFRDDAFPNDIVKTNLTEQLRLAGITTVRSL